MTDCIRQLIDKLNEASYAYYNGKELIMDDAEFDYSLNKLKKLEEETHLVYSDSPTQRVGAPILNSLKKVDISDTGSGFDISFNNHFVRHWEKSDKMMNFNHSDYIEIARRSSLKRLDDDEIKQIAERNLEIYDKL